MTQPEFNNPGQSRTKAVAATSGGTVAASAGHDCLALPVGTRVAEFVITGLVGVGGFGIVYRAHDKVLGRTVSVKDYMPSTLAQRQEGHTVCAKSTRSADLFLLGLNSFVNEARMLALFDHPALVKVYRFWEANGTAYMAMPFYEGQTLQKTLVQMPAPPTEGWLCELLHPLLAALEIIHAQHCFHRDIAPDNILMLDNGQPVLLDFGAARQVIGDMAGNLTVILKPGFAPVEQHAADPNLPQGPWTDIYALGAVLHLAITGQAPCLSVSRLVTDHYAPLAQRCAGSYTQPFLQTVDQALGVWPADRPQTISDLRQRFALTTRAPEPAAPMVAPAAPSLPDKQPAQGGRLRLLWVGGVMAVVVGAAGIFLLGLRSQPAAGAAALGGKPTAAAMITPAAPTAAPATAASTGVSAPTVAPGTAASTGAPTPNAAPAIAASTGAPAPAVAPGLAASAAMPVAPRTPRAPVASPPPALHSTAASALAKPKAQSGTVKPYPPPSLAKAKPQEAAPAPAPGKNEGQSTPQWLREMRRELAVCNEQSFVTRIFCIDQARRKYCGPSHWGEVQECHVSKTHTGD